MRTKTLATAVALLATSCLDADLLLTDLRPGAIGDCRHVGLLGPGGGGAEVVPADGTVFLLVSPSYGFYAVVAVRPGGEVETVFGPATDRISHLTVAADRLYFVASSSDHAFTALWSVPLAGGAPTEHAQLDASNIPITALVVDGATAIFGTPFGVYAVPIDGGAAGAIALPPNGEVRWLASDGTNVFFMGYDGLFRVPVGGGTPVGLLAGDPDATAPFFGAALGETSVFLWSADGLWRVPKTSTAAPLGPSFATPAPLRVPNNTSWLMSVAYAGSELVFCAATQDYWSIIGSVSVATGQQSLLAADANWTVCTPGTALAGTAASVYVWESWRGDLCVVPR